MLKLRKSAKTVLTVLNEKCMVYKVHLIDWKTRVKYVDDLSVLMIIPRCSTSMLPFVARDICSYASSHGMKLNPSKCKELRIDFLQYKPSDLPPLQMSGSIIEQVSSYKLLRVHLSHN